MWSQIRSFSRHVWTRLLMEYWQKSEAQKQLVSLSEVCVLGYYHSRHYLLSVCLLPASTTATELRNSFRYSLCMYINSTSHQPFSAAIKHPSILLYISQRHDVKMAFISVFWLEGGLERLPGLLSSSGVQSCSTVFVYAVKLSHWDFKTSKSRAWPSWKHFSHTYKMSQCLCIR